MIVLDVIRNVYCVNKVSNFRLALCNVNRTQLRVHCVAHNNNTYIFFVNIKVEISPARGSAV